MPRIEAFCYELLRQCNSTERTYQQETFINNCQRWIRTIDGRRFDLTRTRDVFKLTVTDGLVNLYQNDIFINYQLGERNLGKFVKELLEPCDDLGGPPSLPEGTPYTGPVIEQGPSALPLTKLEPEEVVGVGAVAVSVFMLGKVLLQNPQLLIKTSPAALFLPTEGILDSFDCYLTGDSNTSECARAKEELGTKIPRS